MRTLTLLFPFSLYSDPLSGTTLWYDSSQPTHPRLHQSHVGPVLEMGSTPRSLRPLIHSLRAVKSSAEVALMQEAGHISAQVGVYIAYSAIVRIVYIIFPSKKMLAKKQVFMTLYCCPTLSLQHFFQHFFGLF